MLKTILFRLGHLGFLVGLGGASLVYGINIIAGHPTAWQGPAFAFLTVFVVYNFDHLRDSQKADKASTPERSRYMYKYARLFKFLIGGCALGYCLSAWLYRPFFLCVGLFYVLCGVFYVVPLIPGKRIKRLKDIPMFKNFYVPACWLILILYSKADLRHLTAGIGMALAYFFVRIFISTTVGDIRDHVGDRAAGIRTIALWIGRNNAFLLLQSLNLFAVGMVVFACVRHIWPYHSLIMILSIVYIMVLLRIFQVEPRHGEFISEIYDFELISYGPFLLAMGLAFP